MLESNYIGEAIIPLKNKFPNFLSHFWFPQEYIHANPHYMRILVFMRIFSSAYRVVSILENFRKRYYRLYEHPTSESD